MALCVCDFFSSLFPASWCRCFWALQSWRTSIFERLLCAFPFHPQCMFFLKKPGSKRKRSETWFFPTLRLFGGFEKKKGIGFDLAKFLVDGAGTSLRPALHGTELVGVRQWYRVLKQCGCCVRVLQVEQRAAAESGGLARSPRVWQGSTALPRYPSTCSPGQNRAPKLPWPQHHVQPGQRPRRRRLWAQQCFQVGALNVRACVCLSLSSCPCPVILGVWTLFTFLSMLAPPRSLKQFFTLSTKSLIDDLEIPKSPTLFFWSQFPPTYDMPFGPIFSNGNTLQGRRSSFIVYFILFHRIYSFRSCCWSKMTLWLLLLQCTILLTMQTALRTWGFGVHSKP